MSTSLKRLPTEWLDKQDARGNEDTNGRRTATKPSKNHLHEVELIIGRLSLEPSTEFEHSGLPKSATPKNRPTETYKRDILNQYQDESAVCMRYIVPNSLRCEDIGTARLIGNRTFFVLRVISMGTLGILVGVCLSNRKEANAKSLVMELFVWLHPATLLLMPFLVAGSVMTLNYANQSLGEKDIGGHYCNSWTALAYASHVARTFAITELIRLLIFGYFPMLQPFLGVEETGSLYSLRSSFAIQRYALGAVAIVEILFSTTPQHWMHIVAVFICSASWETIIFLLRSTHTAIGKRLTVLFGSVSIAIITSTAIVLFHCVIAQGNNSTKGRHGNQCSEMASV